jgi:hypothetical protein
MTRQEEQQSEYFAGPVLGKVCILKIDVVTVR